MRTAPLLFLAATGLLSSLAMAAPLVDGTPRWSTTRAGISEFGSRTSLHADLDSDAPLAIRTHDAAAAGAAPLLEIEGRIAGAGDRRLTFESWGWTEELSLAPGTLRVQAFTWGRDIFAFVFEVEGTTAPVPLELVLRGDAEPNFRGAGAGSMALITLEDHWYLSFEITPGTPRGVLLAQGVMDKAQFDLATLGAGTIPEWLQARTERWTSWTTSPAAVEGEPQKIAEALALLRMASISGALGELPVRAKGRLPTLALEDLGLVARALADQEPARAQAILEALLAGRGLDGRMAAELTPDGVPPGEATRIPRFLGQWLAVAERSGTDAQAIMTRALELERGVIAWWVAERDRDQDAALECNGGLEAGTPGSPRLLEIWPTDPDVAVAASSGRVPMDCVEAGAWLHALAVEAARLAEALGQDPQPFRSEATRRSLEVEDPTQGHWDPERSGWFDYVRTGEEETRQTLEARTHVLWSPMTTGLARESVRITAVGEALLGTGVFWTGHGVASVALDQANVRVDPAARWQGAVQPEVDWSALLALSRYGYEAEAAALRASLLSRPFVSAVEARTGEALGPADDAVAASIFLLAAAHADEAEVLLFQRGGLAKERRGHFQRVFRPGDGRLLLEVDTGNPRLLPELTLRSDSQLFSGDPMSVAVGDPSGRLAGVPVRLTFPAFLDAEGEVEHADGSRTPIRLEEGVWEAQAGQTLHLSRASLGGSPEGCGCRGGPGSAAGLGGLLLVLLLGGRRARIARWTPPG